MLTANSILFSTAYLPPIEYFVAFLKTNNALLEIHEHFKRRSYSNHCLIANVSGPHQLTIPVTKTCPNHCPIKDIRIDYSEKWQHTHWKTLETSYNKSPFFLYYKDYFEPFYTKKIPYLLDYNLQLFDVVCNLLKIKHRFTTTNSYINPTSDNLIDVRESIDLKKRTLPDYPFKNMQAYRQVFEDKIGFIPNLSIIDLLFNKGAQTKDYLMQHLHLLSLLN
ncbi:MAG TPA: WbqC family protein [Bacteroidales bacterium]|jgi:hypothetical protein|nr:WbqC family protein [Bacteroidales bacterium]HOF15493.1 WbqC family protein [Bacteroidales bacterium]HON20692.1 WbqC family protein [Bacteroidales bacterium]HOR81549.1 WbqC family protein [Bacteroidales bacterium]HPJ90373.1 WbqC family protein [Bacteroidales bacterium]